MSHKNSKIQNRKDTFVSAAAISVVGLFLTRIISVIYVIPFSAMIKGDAMSINNYAYSMFSQFYELSLAGLPLAIARLISMYNAKEEYKTSNRILKYGQRIMISLGVLLSLIFFFSAKPFAIYQTKTADVDFIKNLTLTMQIIAPALIILPFMSGMRGYLQGFKTVIGTSISQVVERLAFVAILIGTLYITIYQLGFTPERAIAYAYIALPIASLIAIAVLLPFYRNIRQEHKELMSQEKESRTYETKALLKQITLTALPFVIAGLASTAYMGITTMTYEKVRIWSGVSAKLATIEYNAFIFDTNKLVSIPLTFSLAMSTSIISFVTAAFESHDKKAVQNYVNKSYRMIIFSTLGAVILMIMLGKPLLTFFYQYNEYTDYTAKILAFDGFRGLFFAVETIVISLLQSLGRKNKAVLYTAVGPIVKLILTVPLVYLFGIYGEILSVIIGLFIAILLATREIIQITDIKVKVIYNACLKTFLCLAPSMLYLGVVNYATNLFFPEILMGRISAFVYVAIMGILSLMLFLLTAEKTGFLQVVFGKEFTLGKLFERFKLKR